MKADLYANYSFRICCKRSFQYWTAARRELWLKSSPRCSFIWQSAEEFYSTENSEEPYINVNVALVLGRKRFANNVVFRHVLYDELPQTIRTL